MDAHVAENEEMRDEDHALWMTDHIALTTVGIDIGSATSQMVFSGLELRRMGRELSSRYAVVSRDIIYRSPTHLTPYLRDEDIIDEGALQDLFDAGYKEARLTPDDVDAGAVILTGEAIRRRNARAIADLMATQGGQFVCAAAGHHMESLMAAHGSGAVALSREGAQRILNIDIGGGTTKFALVEDGVVVRTAALHVGGRLVAVDELGRISRLEPAGAKLAADCGYAWRHGDRVAPEDLQRVGWRMARAVLAAVAPEANGERNLWLTEPIGYVDALDGVVYSGGVSEYIYDSSTAYRDDLGESLGMALRQCADALPAPVRASRGRILATVIGASQHSVQVSGNTIYVSDPVQLPLRNLRVLRPRLELGETVDARAVSEAIRNHFADFDLVEGDVELALAFDWHGPPSFRRISALVDGIRDAVPRTIELGNSLCLVFDHDVARLVGALVHETLGPSQSVVAVDGITLRDFDFIDIGNLMEASQTIPITIKSLVFDL